MSVVAPHRPRYSSGRPLGSAAQTGEMLAHRQAKVFGHLPNVLVIHLGEKNRRRLELGVLVGCLRTMNPSRSILLRSQMSTETRASFQWAYPGFVDT